VACFTNEKLVSQIVYRFYSNLKCQFDSFPSTNQSSSKE